MNHPEYELVASYYPNAKTLPVLWSIGAKAFASEIGKLAAGKVLTAVLSEPPLSRADVAQLLDMAVAEIKRHITDSLTEKTISELKSHVDGSLDLLSQFAHTPKIEQRLDRADAESSLAINGLKEVGHQALTTYVYALQVKLLCVVASYKHRKYPSEIIVYESQLSTGAGFIESCVEQIQNSLKLRINNIGSVSVANHPIRIGTDPIGGDTSIDNWIGSFNNNGKLIHSDGFLKKSEARRQAELKKAKVTQFYQEAIYDFKNSVAHPISEIISVLYEVLDSLHEAHENGLTT